MAFRILFNSEFAGKLLAGLKVLEAPVAKSAQPVKPVVLPPEKVHASGLVLLAALQREGRLIDFLQQDVAGFSDEQVGGAARVVHAGCGKVLKQYFELEPATAQPEGAAMSIPQGFDAQRIRLTGNVSGQPPYHGTLKHHGWFAKTVRMPELAESLNAKVIAPAEVELS